MKLRKIRNFPVEVYAVYLKELTRLKRSKSRLITAIIMPFLWLATIGTAYKSSVRLPMPIDFLSFLTPGIMAMSMVFSGTISGVSTVFDREFGFLKEMLVAPISREAIVVGKMLGGVTQAVMQGAIILFMSWLMGMDLHSGLPTSKVILGVFTAMLLISGSFVSMGLAIASKMSSTESFHMIMSFLIQPMIFLSGAMYPTSLIPDWLKIPVRINPLTYGVDLIRYYIVGMAEFNIAVDYLILIVYTASMIMLGGQLFRKA